LIFPFEFQCDCDAAPDLAADGDGVVVVGDAALAAGLSSIV
jgi:predicted solute-binding protein